jgi:hypothetical protein
LQRPDTQKQLGESMREKSKESFISNKDSNDIKFGKKKLSDEYDRKFGKKKSSEEKEEINFNK